MKTRLAHPLISCICITSNRPQMLLKNIVSFDTQNYPNRELVISYPKQEFETRNLINHIKAISELNILTVERETDESVGQARNKAIEICNGEYVCCWDDDDLYHYNRITHQFNSMQGNYYQAGILSKVLIYDTVEDKAYQSYAHNWGGTLICKKELIVRHPYGDSNSSEDVTTLNSLDSRGYLLSISDAPFLYVLIRHHQNATQRIYFQKFLNISNKLDANSTRQIRQQYETQINLV